MNYIILSAILCGVFLIVPYVFSDTLLLFSKFTTTYMFATYIVFIIGIIGLIFLLKNGEPSWAFFTIVPYVVKNIAVFYRMIKLG